MRHSPFPSGSSLRFLFILPILSLFLFIPFILSLRFIRPRGTAVARRGFPPFTHGRPSCARS